MEFFDFIVKIGSGKKSYLDKEYRNLITQSIQNEELEIRWEIYNLIVKDLIDADNGKYFEELKYRITDGENPNTVILNILQRYDENELGPIIWMLKKRVEEFEEDDFFNRFF